MGVTSYPVIVRYGSSCPRTSTAWRNDAGRWLLGLAERVEVTSNAPGFPAKSRVVEQTHDPGALEQRGVIVGEATELLDLARARAEFRRDASNLVENIFNGHAR